MNKVLLLALCALSCSLGAAVVVVNPGESLTKARDALRAAAGGTIVVKGGVHPVAETLELSADDRISLRAAPGERPVLDGGWRVKSFRREGKLLVADVKAQGYDRLEPMTSFGFYASKGRPQPAIRDLYANGRRLELAREPDAGWFRVYDVPDLAKGNPYRTLCWIDGIERFTKARSPHLMARGYWRVYWADDTVHAAVTDEKEHEITFSGDGFSGSNPDRPFYLFNTLSALDTPGEWYLDVDTGLVYVMPRPGEENAEYVLSRLPGPMIDAKSSDIAIEGLELRYGCGDAVLLSGERNVSFRNNRVHDFGGKGLVAGVKWNLDVSWNVISRTGRGSAVLSDIGDIRTLTPGRARIYANDFGFAGQWWKTYSAGLGIGGCGATVANNWIHDLPAHGMNPRGNDLLIASNLVERVSYETDDQGGSDTFGSLAYRDLRFVHNIWRDIGPEPDFATCGAGGVRLDDLVSGNFIYGNRFIRAAKGHFGGVQINGGYENTIDNNVFVGCRYAVSFMYPMTPWQWRNALALPRSKKYHYEDVDISKPPFSTRYPQLTGFPQTAGKNRITRNVAVGSRALTGPDGTVHSAYEASDNIVAPAGDPERLLSEAGFDPLPPESAIGIPVLTEGND